MIHLSDTFWTRVEVVDNSTIYEHKQLNLLPVAVIFYDTPPVVPDIYDIAAFRKCLEKQASKRVFFIFWKQIIRFNELEIKKFNIGSIMSYLSILAVPNADTGFTYIGTYTIPLEFSCYEIKCQMKEEGITGARETIMALKEGSRINPYDEKYDKLFPDHPLTKVRETLRGVEDHIIVDGNKIRSYY